MAMIVGNDNSGTGSYEQLPLQYRYGKSQMSKRNKGTERK